MARSDFLLVLAVHGATQAKENVKVHLWFFFFCVSCPYIFVSHRIWCFLFAYVQHMKQAKEMHKERDDEISRLHESQLARVS